MQGPVETADAVERILDDLRRLASEQSFERFEALWMEAAENLTQVAPKIHAFLDLAESVVQRSKEAPRVGTLLELVSGAVSDATPAPQAVRYFGLLVRCFPTNKEYRSGFADRFEKLYPLASAERVFYEASGFSGAANPAQALVRLEKLLRFREGSYVVHPSGWGVGKVLAVDPFLKQVRVDLEHKKDHRIAIHAVDSILEPLAPDSFLVLSHQGGDELRRLREEDPTRLVGLVLDTFGNPLALKDVKAKLIPTVIEANGWNKWWNRVKGLLRENGRFRVGDRAPYHIERLAKAVSYEDELVHNFRRAEWPQARAIARTVARRSPGELETAWQQVKERLEAMAAAPTNANGLEAALIWDRGETGNDRSLLRQVFARYKPQELVAALQDLPGAEEQRRAVESFPQTRPEDWREMAILLFRGKKDTPRQAAVELLEREAPDKIQAELRDLARLPKASPEAFCSMLQAHLEGA